MAVSSNVTEKTYKPGAAMAAEPLTGLVFFDPDDLVVEHWIAGATYGALLMRDVDYTISGDGAAAAGEITALAEYPVDDEFRIRRETPALQENVFPYVQPLSSKDIEEGLDRSILGLQELKREDLRALKVPRGESGFSIPAVAMRKKTIFGFDADGTNVVYALAELSLLLADQLGTAFKGDKGDPGANVMAIGLFSDLTALEVPAGTTRVRTAGHTWDGVGPADYRYDPVVDAAYVAAHPLTSAIDLGGRGFRLDMFEMGLEHAGGRSIALGAAIDGTYSAANTAAIKELKALQSEDTVLRIIKLGKGQWEIDEPITFAYDGIRVHGSGFDRTCLKNIAPGIVSVANGACISIGDANYCEVQDIHLFGQSDYGVVKSFHSNTRNVKFRRVKFTTETYSINNYTSSTNAVKVVVDNSTIGAHDWLFEDCWIEPGRMGIEFQNHAAGSDVKYTGIRVVRCAFIRCGTQNQQAGYTAWQATSWSGYGYDVVQDDCYYDGNIGILTENVGCSRLIVRNKRIRAATYVAATSIIFSYTNYRQMWDCEIDGVAGVVQAGDSLPTTGNEYQGMVQAAWGTSLFRNCVRLNMRRCYLNSINASGYMFSASMDGVSTTTYPTINGQDISFTDSDVRSASTTSIWEIRTCGGVHSFKRNRLRSLASAGAIGHFNSNVTVNADAAGYAVGATQIPLDAASTGAILAGATIIFSNDPNRRYRVLQRSAGGSGAVLKFFPPLKTAIPAAVTAITLFQSVLDIRGGNVWECPNFSNIGNGIPVANTGNANFVRADHSNTGDCVTRKKVSGTILSAASSAVLYHNFGLAPGSAVPVATGAWGADVPALAVDYSATTAVTVSASAAVTANRAVECIVERPEVW